MAKEGRLWPRLLALAALCLLAYAPALSLPLFEDDYPLLSFSWQYGPPAALGALWHTVYGVRATSIWLIWLLWHAFQLTPAAYHAASLALHIVNVWLVYALARAWTPMRPAAFWAAAFFAVAEGHQEAVIWFAANSELLMFMFGTAALLCWIRGRSLFALPLFALALISKESAVVLVALFELTDRPAPWKDRLLRLSSYALLAALLAAMVFAGRDGNFRFSDGSFSLDAPFWLTWPRNFARVLWPWGWLAAAAIFASGQLREFRRAAGLALAWIGISLLPYSFLTYSAQIPSRQTYLASAGLAFLVGLSLAGLLAGGARGTLGSRRLAAAAMALILAANVGYLWTKKRAQFIARAAPTDELIHFARENSGPIWVQCFPRNNLIASEAVRVGAGRDPSILVWNAADARRRDATAVFCYQEAKAPGRR